MRSYAFNIPAGETRVMPVSGITAAVYQSTGEILVAFDDEPPSKMERGIKRVKPFSRVVITNPSATVAVSGEVMLGAEGFEDNRIFGSLALDAPDTLFDAVDVTVPSGAGTLILAANSARREAFIVNSTAATFRIGTANVAANRGLPLSPGGSMILTTKAALYAYQASGGALALSVAFTE